MLLRTQPDDRLAAMAHDGSRAAFDEIVRRHRTSLIAYAGSLAPPSRAEDVVQESLTKAYVALREGARPELLRAWLFRIVRNTAIDEQRGVRPYEQLDENYDGVEQPPQALDRREQVAALVVAIQDLPEAQREAIVQRELEGKGHAEIGRALQVSSGSVRQLIYRARHSLRETAGVIIPAAVIRAACIPGADEAVGGIGAAAAVKVGLAALVASGTIVAGAEINKGTDGGPAEAVQISNPQRNMEASGSGAAGETESRDRLENESERHGSGSSGEGESENSGPGGDGVSGGSEHSGSGGGDHSSNSGPGSGSSGESGSGSNSGPGSGSSGSGSGSGVSGGGSDDGSGTSGSDDLLELDGGASGGTSGPG